MPKMCEVISLTPYPSDERFEPAEFELFEQPNRQPPKKSARQRMNLVFMVCSSITFLSGLCHEISQVHAQNQAHSIKNETLTEADTLIWPTAKVSEALSLAFPDEPAETAEFWM